MATAAAPAALAVADLPGVLEFEATIKRDRLQGKLPYLPPPSLRRARNTHRRLA